MTGWRVEISPCYNSRGNTGVDKRVFLSDQYAILSGQLLITHSMNIRCAHSAQTIFLGAPKTHFDPRKTLNVYLGLIMINPQKPVINLIKNCNRFIALIYICVCFCIYIYMCMRLCIYIYIYIYMYVVLWTCIDFSNWVNWTIYVYLHHIHN